MSKSLPAFVEDVPDYEVVEGRMHIYIKDFTLVMPVPTFLKGCARGTRAVKEWNKCKRGEVVPFPGAKAGAR